MTNQAFLKLLKFYLHKWQARLGLADWAINIRLPNKKDQISDDWVAACCSNPRLKTGTIVVRADLKDKGWEIETTVLHELVHFHFGNETVGNRAWKKNCDVLEAGVEATAMALYKTEYPRWKDPRQS